MFYRNNAGRLSAGFINVCLETHWLGPKRCFYVPGWSCNLNLRSLRDMMPVKWCIHEPTVSAWALPLNRAGHTISARDPLVVWRLSAHLVLHPVGRCACHDLFLSFFLVLSQNKMGTNTHDILILIPTPLWYTYPSHIVVPAPCLNLYTRLLPTSGPSCGMSSGP